MKARPILFSKDMAEAVMNGIKTQTRRIIKDSFNGCWTGGVQGHPCPNDPVVFHPGEELKNYDGSTHVYEAETVEAWFLCSTMEKLAKCKYGKVGDILWGRETIWTGPNNKVFYEKPGLGSDVKYKATPSIHMKQIYSRIWLQITDIRVERLLDISEGDAIAEGIEGGEGLYRDYSAEKWAKGNIPPKDSYLTLWDKINGKDSRKINPWVWVVEFKDIGFEKAMLLLNS